MSGSDEMGASRRAIEEAAARLVVELAARDDPDAERQALDFAGRSDRHGVALAQAQRAWETAERLRATPPAADGEDEPALSRSRLPGRRAAIGGLIAATLVAGALGIAIGHAPRADGYETGVGEHRTLLLADGSKVSLNTDSAIEVAIGETERSVRLVRGEALFDVAHEAKRPFRVTAGDSAMQVLGTAFNVRMREHLVELTVSRGAVGVRDGSGGLARVPAGESAAIRGRTVAIATVDRRTLARRTAWRDGVITLDGETLEQAIDEFNRYSPTPIVIGDPDLAGLRVGGSFGTHEAAKFIEALQTSFEIRAVAGPDRSILLTRDRAAG